MVQQVKGLRGKHESLSSDSHVKPGVYQHVCYPSIRGIRQMHSWYFLVS